MFRTLALIAASLAAGLLPIAAGAAEFSVTPIRIDLERGARSAAVTVTNDDARPLRMQMRLVEWTQDADGKDVYQDSDELVYFPKLMSVQAGEKRLVRIGLKTPIGATERTYRLLLDELPEAASPAGVSGLNFTLRFALPVFLPAAAPLPRGAIEAVALRDGKLSVTVRNTGNQHFRIASVAARSGEAFAAEASGWYLLPGVARVHTLEVPVEACRGLRRLDITVKTDKLSLEGGLDVESWMCAR